MTTVQKLFSALVAKISEQLVSLASELNREEHLEHLVLEDLSLEELLEYHREPAGSHDLLERLKVLGLRRNIGSVWRRERPTIESASEIPTRQAEREQTMIRSLINVLAFNAFVLLLPLFGAMAWFAGSNDERFLMKAATCALGPLCVAIWLIILRKGKWSSLLVIPLGYGLIILLLRMRVIVF